MSSSHSGLLKDSLDRPVHLKDIKHYSRPPIPPPRFLFFFLFPFFIFFKLARPDFFCEETKEGNEKGGDKNRDREGGA